MSLGLINKPYTHLPSTNYFQGGYALCDEEATNGFHLLLRYGKSCEDDRQAITDERCSTYGLYLYKIVEQYSLQPKKRKASPKPMVKMK